LEASKDMLLGRNMLINNYLLMVIMKREKKKKGRRNIINITNYLLLSVLISLTSLIIPK
jgi:low temperature requirement protein LtrA